MESIGKFKDYLDRFVKFTDAEFEEYLAPVIHEKKFDKKEMLTKAGEVENYFYFITNGLLRKFYRKGPHEINTQISTEGHIIHSQESFHSRLPSEYFIEAIEPSTVVAITYDDLERVFSASKKLEHLGRLVITHTMVIKDRWHMRQVKMTPRERFLHFVTKYPELMQRVPQKFLATYLNIKPETFSRFKHLLKEHVKKAEVSPAKHPVSS